MKESKILKTISYVLLPILVGIMILSLLYSVGRNDYSNSYFESEKFTEDYLDGISQIVRSLIYEEEAENMEEDAVRIVKTYYSYFSNISDHYYLIVYNGDKAITNVDLDEMKNLNEIKEFIKAQDGKKLTIEKGKIKESSLYGNLSKYKNDFVINYYSMNNESSDLQILQTTKFNDFDIYTTYKENMKYDTISSIMNIISQNEDAFYSMLPVCSIFIAIIIIYLIISIGHTKGKSEIDLNDLDKTPLELLIILVILITLILGSVISICTHIRYEKLMLSLYITAYFVIYIEFIVMFITIVKRLKAKVFFKTTLIGMLVNFLEKTYRKVSKEVSDATSKIKLSRKVLLTALFYGIAMILIIAIFDTYNMLELGLLIDFIILMTILYKAIKTINSIMKIKEKIQDIYEGNKGGELDLKKLTPLTKETAMYVNDISKGFEHAVEEGLKSERLKTELITNVSHDIKTPLTSIINYIDLIKKENVKNEKVKEYIGILENKAERLKRLTEDLVEASKASSGNVNLNLEKINVGELIKQTTGEFEDKFKKRGLEVVTNIQDEELFIEADSRYMYRVIENLFSNVSKYATKKTRVYIDVFSKDTKINIIIKNISQERLNITTDELMQRFVRGDKSRTTEGSGLRIIYNKKLN